jgi:rhodanese-related sulfurtransferase
MQHTRILLFTILCATILLASAALLSAAEPQKAPYSTVTTEELNKMLDSGKNAPLVIDARNPEEYDEVHIKNAVNIPVAKLEKNPALLPADKQQRIVFYCNGIKCGKSKKAAQIAAAQGYPNLMVYAEGMPVWEEKGMSIYAGPNYEKKIETSKLKPGELKSLMESKPTTLTIVDVRDKAEYDQGHIPGAINIPVAIFALQSGVLEKDKRIIVYCNSGGRSYNAYRKLQKLAYPNINQVIFADWEFDGFPVVK